jgi:nucleoside-diphosphate-sugar epimerase/O-antigen/teichoic acid export membrane protein
MRRIVNLIIKRKNFILFSLLKISVTVLGLGTNIVIVRKLSVNDFGIFSVVFMLIGLVTTFGFSWSSSSILYYGGKDKARHGNINRTFWARNIIIFFSLIGVTLVTFIFGKQINDYIGMKVSFLLLIWLYVSVAEDYLSQYFLAVKKQILSSMLSITAKLVYLGLILLVPFDVKSLIKLNIASHATVLLYIFAINKKDIGKFEFDRAWFKEVLNFSLWQLFGFSGIYLVNFGDTAVIKYFLTTEDVGIYNAAYKIFNSITGFAYVISSYYAASVSDYFEKKDHKKLKDFFFKERYVIFALSTLVHIIVIVFSKPIITLLYGERYLESVKIFNILMAGSIFRYISVFYMLYYNTNKKHRLQQSINILRAVLNIGLDIVLIKYFGLIGPAIATAIAVISTFIFSALYCEKRLRASSRETEQLSEKSGDNQEYKGKGELNMGNVLITGGAGFIGSHLTESLLKAGNRVIVIDNFNDYYDPELKRRNMKEVKETLVLENIPEENYRLYEGDIRDVAILNRVFDEKIDAVVHLAAMGGVRYSIEHPELYYDVNINGTLKLLEKCRERDIKQFVFASSSSVYGNKVKVPFSEEDNVDYPISPYAATKKSGELLCHTYHHLYGINIACLRFFTVYGPRQRPDLAIHKFTELMLQDKEIPLYGDGGSIRDYTYVDDIVDGIVRAIEWAHVDEKRFDIFNLGNSSAVSLGDMVETLERSLGVKARIRRLEAQAGDVNRTLADISKANRILGYHPSRPLSEGIGEFVKWVRSRDANRFDISSRG